MSINRINFDEAFSASRYRQNYITGESILPKIFKENILNLLEYYKSMGGTSNLTSHLYLMIF